MLLLLGIFEISSSSTRNNLNFGDESNHARKFSILLGNIHQISSSLCTLNFRWQIVNFYLLLFFFSLLTFLLRCWKGFLELNLTRRRLAIKNFLSRSFMIFDDVCLWFGAFWFSTFLGFFVFSVFFYFIIKFVGKKNRSKL